MRELDVWLSDIGSLVYFIVIWHINLSILREVDDGYSYCPFVVILSLLRNGIMNLSL
jgi:hypothetical protein